MSLIILLIKKYLSILSTLILNLLWELKLILQWWAQLLVDNANYLMLMLMILQEDCLNLLLKEYWRKLLPTDLRQIKWWQYIVKDIHYDLYKYILIILYINQWKPNILSKIISINIIILLIKTSNSTLSVDLILFIHISRYDNFGVFWCG